MWIDRVRHATKSVAHGVFLFHKKLEKIAVMSRRTLEGRTCQDSMYSPAEIESKGTTE